MKHIPWVKLINTWVFQQAGTLIGTDGREKAVVCFPGSESSLLRERQERIKLGWKVE